MDYSAEHYTPTKHKPKKSWEGAGIPRDKLETAGSMLRTPTLTKDTAVS
jgi:hypothetical protein